MTEQLRGLNSVRVQKTVVLKQLKDNRKAHRKIFEEALEGFEKEVIKRLEEGLDDAKNRKKFVPYFNIPQPSDHTDDYDLIIEMLEMGLDDELILSQQEFRQYMKDDWGWKQDFLTTNATYSAGAARELGRS